MRLQCANEKHQAITLSSIKFGYKASMIFPAFQAIEQRAKGARAEKLAQARDLMQRGWCYEWNLKVEYSEGCFLKNKPRDLAKNDFDLY